MNTERPAIEPAVTVASETSLVDWLVSWLSSRLDVPAAAIDVRERFSRYGVSSPIALELVSALSAALQRPLAATLLWDHPTIEALTRYLRAAPHSPEPSGPRRRAGLVAGEPVAVVGIACRLPRAEDQEAFWRLLQEGKDALSEIPPERWNADTFYDPDRSAPGKSNARRGGFLRQVDSFDPLAFGISPREAAQMDPQQRLMLELSWEAFEDAGLPVDALRGVDAGVFFGAMWAEYGRLGSTQAADIGAHTATGQDSSIIAARVSYTFGLEGPSLTVNTACSSSLVAVHLACQSLRAGESAIALAGGVNLMLLPESTVAMAKFGALSSDGRSKAFDARADGYARGEGAGVVVLKPLSQALRDGDTIYCVIRGTAVNNDGFSNGLTAPNPQAQERVLRAAYEAAGVAPADVHYVEAHGTGTRLGDPIEAKALGRVLGEGRPEDRPLWLGSVKTNIGHLEAAAGIAGLIKVALSMKHRELPASLHFEAPNPEIDFEGLKLRVQREAGPWPGPAEAAPLAGVSSFGFGGTNAHVVVEGLPPTPELLPLSAESLGALREAARSFATFAAESRAPLAALCRAAGRRSSAGPHRLASTARSRRALVAQLESFAQGQPAAGQSWGERPERRSKLVFVYSGNGAQWLGMGRALLRSEPLFRAELGRWDARLRPLTGASVIEALCADDAAHFERVDVLQPLLFAVQLSLTALIRSWGIEPDAVVGHSLGEVTAACVAGALEPDAAARVVSHRSRLIQRIAGRGTMAVVEMPQEELERAIAARQATLAVGGSNEPGATLLSGESAALEETLAELEKRNIACHRIRIDFAAHSPQVDPLLVELGVALADVEPRPGAVPMFSTVTADRIDGRSLGAGYWKRNLREPVRFAQTIARLAREGYDLFFEISPHAILTRSIERCLAVGGQEGIALGSLQRGEDDRLALLEAVGRLYTHGTDVRWSKVASPCATEVRALSLPGATQAPASAESGEGAALFVLSATTKESLRALASSVAAQIEAAPGVSLEDLAYTTGVRRAHHEHRMAVVARSPGEIVDGVRSFARSEASPGVFAGRISSGRARKLAFVFCGQGPQRAGMGCALAKREPVFRAALDACDELFQRLAGWSLWAELSAPEERSRLRHTEIAQPALFALQVALVALWRSWGIEPAAVLGHSVGEVAAAYASGTLRLEEAARIVVRRGHVMQRATGLGQMAVVELPSADVEVLLAPYAGRLSVAAINSARETVVAGDGGALEELLASIPRKPWPGGAPFVRNLGVDYAFHTPQMEPLREVLRAELEEVAAQAAAIPFYSTVTGQRVAGEALDAGYWARGIREPVRFAAAVDALLTDKVDTIVEIGPHPVLARPLTERLAADGLLLSSLRRGREERETLLNTLAALYVCGFSVRHAALHDGAGHIVRFPPPAFQRERFWIDPPPTSNKQTMSQTLKNESPSSAPVLDRSHGQDALVSYYATLSAKSHRWEHLRFGPFAERVPGYSWVLTWAEPEKHPEDLARVVAALEEGRRFIFRGIDFSALSHVLDVGCGYSSDLMRLSEEHRHLKLHGFNISPDQVELGRRRIREVGLADRITLFNLDSAKNDFPGQYDLVMAFQVIHHIQDKASVFANIGRHLRNGGFAVMAEILSNMSTPIDHPESTAYFVPKEQWAEELARNRLRVVECVDMSHEVSNFLHEDDFEARFVELTGRHDEVTLHHLRGPHQLGLLLEKGLTIYALLRVQKDDYLLPDEILRINMRALTAPTPYAHFTAGAPAAAPPAAAARPKDATEELAAAILAASPEERRARCETQIRRWVSGLLQIQPSRLDAQEPLRRFGLDSMMALEIKHRLSKGFGLEVSAVELLSTLTESQLVARVMAHLAPDQGPARPRSQWEEGEI